MPRLTCPRLLGYSWPPPEGCAGLVACGPVAHGAASADGLRLMHQLILFVRNACLKFTRVWTVSTRSTAARSIRTIDPCNGCEIAFEQIIVLPTIRSQPPSHPLWSTGDHTAKHNTWRSHLPCRLRQVSRVSSSTFMRGASVISSRPVAPLRMAMRSLSITAAAAPTTERLRLNNLSPQDGARRKNKRKGRGYGAGQVQLPTSSMLRWQSSGFSGMVDQHLGSSCNPRQQQNPPAISSDAHLVLYVQ